MSAWPIQSHALLAGARRGMTSPGRGCAKLGRPRPVSKLNPPHLRPLMWGRSISPSSRARKANADGSPAQMRRGLFCAVGCLRLEQPHGAPGTTASSSTAGPEQNPSGRPSAKDLRPDQWERHHMAEIVGFPCPQCGGRMEVKDSRPASYRTKPSVRRRRSCRLCRWAVTTWEIIDRGEADRDLKLASIIGAARRVSDALAGLIERHEGGSSARSEEERGEPQASEGPRSG